MNFLNISLIISFILFVGLFGCTQEGPQTNPLNDAQLNEDSSQEALLDDDHLHDHSVEIEGKDLKALTVKQVADLWEIDSTVLLNEIIKEFNFEKNYTVNTILEEMRLEYKFSPAIIKDIAERIKTENN
jgi:hypothetical protein